MTGPLHPTARSVMGKRGGWGQGGALPRWTQAGRAPMQRAPERSEGAGDDAGPPPRSPHLNRPVGSLKRGRLATGVYNPAYMGRGAQQEGMHRWCVVALLMLGAVAAAPAVAADPDDPDPPTYQDIEDQFFATVQPVIDKHVEPQWAPVREELEERGLYSSTSTERTYEDAQEDLGAYHVPGLGEVAALLGLSERDLPFHASDGSPLGDETIAPPCEGDTWNGYEQCGMPYGVDFNARRLLGFADRAASSLTGPDGDASMALPGDLASGTTMAPSDAAWNARDDGAHARAAESGTPRPQAQQFPAPTADPSGPGEMGSHGLVTGSAPAAGTDWLALAPLAAMGFLVVVLVAARLLRTISGLALFSRYTRKTILDHPVRQAIYDRVCDEPGVQLPALCQLVGMQPNGVLHHIQMLETQGLVTSRRVAGGRHFFQGDGPQTPLPKEGHAVLQNDNTRRVWEFLRTHPGLTQKESCAALGMSPSLLSWHVKRLEEGNLLARRRDGRVVRYEPLVRVPYTGA